MNGDWLPDCRRPKLLTFEPRFGGRDLQRMLHGDRLAEATIVLKAQSTFGATGFAPKRKGNACIDLECRTGTCAPAAD